MKSMIAMLALALCSVASAAEAPAPADAFPTGTRYEVWLSVDGGAGGILMLPCTTPLNQNVELVTGSNPTAILLHLECASAFEDGYENREKRR